MENIGTIAALLTTASFIPQVIQVIKTNDVESISLVMYIMFWVGVLLWTVYGLYLGDPAIYIANAIVTVLAGVILIYKIRSVRKVKA